MANQQQQKKEQPKTIVSPKGIARFPYLNEPDQGQEDWGDYTPKYKVDLIYDDEPQALIKQIDEAIATAEAEAKQKAAAKKGRKVTPSAAAEPYFPEIDEEGEETGRTVLRFGAKSEYKDKNGKIKPIRIGLFDAKKQPMTETIGPGSTLKVAFKIIPWVNPKLEYGASLRMQAVQVIELSTFGGGADSSVFDEEDGFESSGESSVATDDDEPPFETAVEEDEDGGDF
jgi:hypothetical protein